MTGSIDITTYSMDELRAMPLVTENAPWMGYYLLDSGSVIELVDGYDNWDVITEDMDEEEAESYAGYVYMGLAMDNGEPEDGGDYLYTSETTLGEVMDWWTAPKLIPFGENGILGCGGSAFIRKLTKDETKLIEAYMSIEQDLWGLEYEEIHIRKRQEEIDAEKERVGKEIARIRKEVDLMISKEETS